MEKIISKTNGLILFLFIVLGFVLFYRFDSNYLTHWDEAWHADISRNVAYGEIATLIWNKEPFFDKPPLYFWLSGATMKVFGVGEFAARLPSVMAGLGTGVVLYFLAIVLFNKSTAILAFIVFTSTIGFLFRARTGNLDALFTFFILASILSFYKFYQQKLVKWSIAMGVILGLGFLTKGALIFLFPLLSLLYIIPRRRHRLLNLPFLTGSIFIGIAISLTWVLFTFLNNGYPFIESFLANQLGKISTSSLFWKNFSLEYIWHLKSGLKLWFIPFIAGFIYVFLKWRNSHKIILIIYFVSLFIVLSFSENKSNWFLMPLYPITALAIAYSLNVLGKKIGKKGTVIIIMISFFISSLQLFFYRDNYIVPDIAGDEAKVALAARDLTTADDVLYLTNYYYPTIVYYSQRQTHAVYSENQHNTAWWIKPKDDWIKILQKDRVFIITTREELESLRGYFSQYKFEVLYQSGEKMLLKKV